MLVKSLLWEIDIQFHFKKRRFFREASFFVVYIGRFAQQMTQKNVCF